MGNERRKSLRLTSLDIVSGLNDLIEGEVLYDDIGRMRWGIRGATKEQNLKLAKHQIRATLLSNNPHLSDIARNEQGLVNEHERRAAETIIKQTIKDDDIYRQTIVNIGGLAHSYYPEGYAQIGTSVRFATYVAFGDWGLFDAYLQEFKERTGRTNELRARLATEVPKVVKMKMEDGSTLEIPVVKQKEGAANICDYLDGKIDASELKPVVITDIRERSSNPSGEIYVGKGRKSLIIDKSVIAKYKETGALLFLPQSQFGYTWHDAYQLEQDSVSSSKLGTYRLNEVTGRIESQGWYGPEHQLFFDYLFGNVEVDNPNDLPPFKVPVNKNGIPQLGRMRGKSYSISHHVDTKYQEVGLVTKYDTERDLLWIEGHVNNEGQSIVFERQIVKDGENINFLEWKGVHVQSMVEWIHGKMETALVPEIECEIGDKVSPIIYLGTQKMMIQVNQGNVDPNLPLYLSAREKGPYHWISIDQKPEGELEHIKKVRVTLKDGEPIFDSKWIGPGQQSVYDYVKGDIEKEDLIPFEVTLGSGKVGYVYQDRVSGINMRLVMRSKEFEEGDVVRVASFVDDEGTLFLEAVKETTGASKLFYYDPEIGRLRVLRADQPEEDGGLDEDLLTPEEADEELRKIFYGK